jgi:hypothetical protein
MSNRVGRAGLASNVQASFLRGGISARYLPSADATPFMVHGREPIRLGDDTDTVRRPCTRNQHIPACRHPTDGCQPDPGPGPTRIVMCDTQTIFCATLDCQTMSPLCS